MKYSETSLPGVLLIEPRRFDDPRGFFMETFRAAEFQAAAGAGVQFVQDNHSRSSRGVLRGLHFQTRRPQGKLVRCIRGEVFDVAVGIDPGSAHFGRWFGVRLSADNHLQLWVPPGYAHGFQVLSDAAEVEYKCTEYYDPGCESGLVWDDPAVGIDWPLPDPVLSARDASLPRLSDLGRALQAGGT